MRYSAYYLIEPRPTSIELWGEYCDRDLLAFLAEPRFIEQAEGGRTAWTDDDHALVLKLLFLAELREYSPFDQDESLVRILGSSRIDVALFDRWWSMRRFIIDGHATEMRAILTNHRTKVAPTGNTLVDVWLDELKDA